MDIQKEREAFLHEFEKTEQYRQQYGFYKIPLKYDEQKETWNFYDVQAAWEMWQAAKAQAVPEGFVLINKSDRNQEMLELIDQRDYMESQAEELKDKLQALYGVDFGEHSNCNFPFQNAIDYDDSDLVLVPKEPTLEALKAISAEIIKPNNGRIFLAKVYKAMIEAQEPAND